MASDALRRLAARISDLSIFAGSTGSAGSTTPKSAADCGFSGSDLEPLGGFHRGSTTLAADPLGTRGTRVEPVTGSILDIQKTADCCGYFDGGTPGTLGTHENEKDGNATGFAAGIKSPDRPLVRLGPAAHTTFTGSPNGAGGARRPPAWAELRDMPHPGDRCHCCHGSLWWTETDEPLGWRCWTCHPPHDPSVRQVRT